MICCVCKNPGSKMCSKCYNVRYCSEECQKQDWSEHKNDCKYPELPISYKDPYQKDVMWICDYDEEKKITSVFIGHGEKYVAYIPTLNEVARQKYLLKDQGWVEVKRPNVNFTFTPSDTSHVNRAMRRKMKKEKTTI